MTVDAIGQPIQLNDIVAFVAISSNTITLGIITKLTPKGATMRLMENPDVKCNRPKERIIKINAQYTEFKTIHPEAFI